MSCIGFDRNDNPELHDMYSRKLLIPGWAGEVTDMETKYIAEKLSGSATLRRAWGVRQFFGKRWKRIGPDMAKRLCAAWATNPVLGIKGLSTASGEKRKEQRDTKQLPMVCLL
jgi:hypothetical protein